MAQAPSSATGLNTQAGAALDSPFQYSLSGWTVHPNGPTLYREFAYSHVPAKNIPHFLNETTLVNAGSLTRLPAPYRRIVCRDQFSIMRNLSSKGVNYEP